MIELTFNTDVNPYSADGLINSLRANKGKSINLTVSSFGGDMPSGLDVYYELMKHGKTTVIYRSMSASAATILSMGAKKRKIYENSLILIHKALSPVTFWEWANADDIDGIIESLNNLKANHNAFDSVIASIYYSKMKSKGYSKDDILELMSKDRWLTSNEALEYGLVDEIIPESEDTEDEDLEKMAMVANYYNLPTLPVNNKKTKKVSNNKNMSFTEKIKNFFNANLGLSEEKANDKANEFLTSFDTDIQNSIDERFTQIETQKDEKIEALQNALSDIETKIEALKSEKIELKNYVTFDKLNEVITVEAIEEIQNKINQLGENIVKEKTPKTPSNNENVYKGLSTVEKLEKLKAEGKSKYLV